MPSPKNKNKNKNDNNNNAVVRQATSNSPLKRTNADNNKNNAIINNNTTSDSKNTLQSLQNQMAQDLGVDRENISLLTQPFTTIHNLFYFTVDFIISSVKAMLNHWFFWLLVISISGGLYYSINYAPHPLDTIFSALDINKDGFITFKEITNKYLSSFGFAANPEHFPKGESGKMNKQEFRTFWEERNETEMKSQKLLTEGSSSSHSGEHHDTIRRPQLFHHGLWREFEYVVADAVWWIGLGVASSIGLGSGMHSGLLFMFPHIFSTMAAFSACGNDPKNFWSYPTNPYFGPNDRVFRCISIPSKEQQQQQENQQQTNEEFFNEYFQRMLVVIPWLTLWGLGTAIGEIPPYLVSRQARIEGKEDEEFQEAKEGSGVIKKMKDWMVETVESYGFWGVFGLSCWPNAAFDLVGMACGWILMPFWKFFSALVLGKAVVKAALGQGAFFVVLFSGKIIDTTVHGILEGAATIIPPDYGKYLLLLEQKFDQGLSTLRNQSVQDEASSSSSPINYLDYNTWNFKFVSQSAIFVIILGFIVSTIGQFARSHQREQDKIALEKIFSAAKNSRNQKIQQFSFYKGYSRQPALGFVGFLGLICSAVLFFLKDGLEFLPSKYLTKLSTLITTIVSFNKNLRSSFNLNRFQHDIQQQETFQKVAKYFVIICVFDVIVLQKFVGGGAGGIVRNTIVATLFGGILALAMNSDNITGLKLF